MLGEIKEGRGGLYTVRDDAGQEHVLRAKKKFRRDSLTPLPGDRVRFTPRAGEEHGWLEEILPRSSLCVRPPVANVQLMVIVLAAEPAPDLLLVDKLLVMASLQDIAAVIAVNKGDLGMNCYQQVRESYAGAGIQVVAVSAHTGLGLQALEEIMRGRLSCFAGQSGVGKSALLSRLMEVELVSGEISGRIGRGRQTTRHTTLLYRDGLKVMDTSGFSLLASAELARAGAPALSGLLPTRRIVVFSPACISRSPLRGARGAAARHDRRRPGRALP